MIYGILRVVFVGQDNFKRGFFFNLNIIAQVLYFIYNNM